MTPLLFTIKAFFQGLERAMNDRLSLILFGSSAEQDFADIPLPSERKQQQSPGTSDNSRPQQRSGQRQLKLFFKRPAKRLLLKLVLLIEKAVSSKQTVSLPQNSYSR